MRRISIIIGLVLAALACTAAALPAAAAADDGTLYYDGKWGESGTANGQFAPSTQSPWGIDRDAAGNIFVADAYNDRIQKFTPDGSTVLAVLGSHGSGEGQFINPYDVTVGTDGAVYVLDSYNDRVQKFVAGSGGYEVDPSYDLTIPDPDTTDHVYFGITCDAVGNVYVTHTHRHRVLKFDAGGAYVGHVGRADGTSGSGPGEFDQPDSVAVGPDGRLYVGDWLNHRVQVFTVNVGTFTYVATIGGPGSGSADGLFNNVGGLDVDAVGNVYVCDKYNFRVQVFQQTASGYVFVTKIGGEYAQDFGTDHFREPIDVVAAPDGSVIYVSDFDQEIHRFRRDLSAPTVSDDYDGAWHATDVTVHLAAADEGLSGLKQQPTQYRQDGSTTWLPGDAFTVPATSSGQFTYEYRALDNAENTSDTGVCTVKIDVLAPTVTVGSSLVWSGGDVTVRLLAADGGGSGVQKTQYRPAGSSDPWLDAPADAFTVSPAKSGQFTYEYRALDNAGNSSATGSCVIEPDTVPPTTTLATARSSGWTRTSTLTFAATAGLSGVAFTEYRIDSGPWQRGTSVTLPDGVYTISFRSTSGTGTVETAKTETVRIDTLGPTTRARASARVKKGRYVRLKCTALDVLSPRVRVSVKFYRNGKLKKVWQVSGLKATGRIDLKYRCNLPKGTYRWQVCAVDLAGNRQVKAVKNRLVVW